MIPSEPTKPESGAQLPTPMPGVGPQSGTLLPLDPPLGNGVGTLTLPPALASTPNAMALLRALQRRWLLALTLGLIAAAVAAGVTAFLLPTSKFTARSMLHVMHQQPRVLFGTASEAGADFGTYQKTQSALVKSRLVLNAALRSPKVAELSLIREQPKPIDWLEKEVQIDFSLSPELMRIVMIGEKPQELETLVNALTDAYLQEIVLRDHKKRTQHLDDLKELRNKLQDELKRRRGSVRKMATSIGSGDPHTAQLNHQLAVQQFGMAQGEFVRYQAELRRLEVELRTQQSRQKFMPDATPSEAVVEEVISKDSNVLAYAKRLIQLESELEGIRMTVKPEQFAVKAADTQKKIESLKQDLEKYRQEVRPKIIKTVREANERNYKGYLAALQERIAILKEFESQLGEVVMNLGEKTRQMGGQVLDLEEFRSEITLTESMTTKAMTEVEALSYEIEAPPRVYKLEEAVVTRTNDVGRVAKLASASGAGVFALILLIVSWLEYQTRRVSTGDDVVHGLGLPLVGALPAMPERARRLGTASKARDRHWLNLLTESVDATRTMLLHSARRDALRVVMVTSALSGEGKTSLACHLATSLARAGRKTLLLDGDLRNPSAHRLFEQALEPGFCELLRGEVALTDVARPTQASGLWLVSAGRCDARSIQALAQDGIRDIFRSLKEQYDFVVVDSSPVLPVADTLLIGQHVDAVIFSLLRDVSRLPKVFAAYQRLSSLGIRLLGAVVNGAREDIYRSTYNYAVTATE